MDTAQRKTERERLAVLKVGVALRLAAVEATSTLQNVIDLTRPPVTAAIRRAITLLDVPVAAHTLPRPGNAWSATRRPERRHPAA